LEREGSDAGAIPDKRIIKVELREKDKQGKKGP
jgi:hypothetical protein